MSSDYSGPILELRGVGFRYPGQRELIRELSVSVGSGDFVGLLGANGSGKSTMLKLAAGILQPAAGEVLLWNKRLRDYVHRDRAKLLSYLPQVLDLALPFTVREIAAMGQYPYDREPPLGVDDALELVGLADKAGTTIANLSGGERRRVYIAMTLLQGAGILLLDEPMANLDIRYQIELMRLLLSLRERKGITVVMALHDIGLAFLFRSVLLVKEGRVLASGTPGTVLNDAMLKQAFDVDIEVRRSDKGGAYIVHGLT